MAMFSSVALTAALTKILTETITGEKIQFKGDAVYFPLLHDGIFP